MFGIKRQFQVPSRHEARVTHIHIDAAQTAVPTDGDTVLANQILEFTTFEFSDGLNLANRRPHRLFGVVRTWFQRKECQCIVLVFRFLHRHRLWSGKTRLFSSDSAKTWQSMFSKMMKTTTRGETYGHFSEKENIAPYMVVMRPHHNTSSG